MLFLTENAQSIVTDLAAQPAQPGQPGAAGLRIVSESEVEPALLVSTAAAPEPGDVTVEQDGATVYLDQTAALLLDDKILDAAVHPDGKVEFALAVQP
ncbi:MULTISPECIES: hypothetical protein [unclassified Nocardioides]|uniref:hypothetical protein n=1 Tax=unclassified Nocardioides TaxID=2615069 RepID=UPI0007037B5F|nr:MULTISPECIES: hypothetical protein [unclassified Nocardioides]KQQ43947.1 Fe-S cluster assembly protein HesB [Nocardioides sp. Leaf307]